MKTMELKWDKKSPIQSLLLVQKLGHDAHKSDNLIYYQYYLCLKILTLILSGTIHLYEWWSWQGVSCDII